MKSYCVFKSLFIFLLQNTNNMYTILKHAHSGIMWLVVLLLAISVIVSLIKVIGGSKGSQKGAFKLYKFSKYLIYLQFILGIVLLFISPMVRYSGDMMKDASLRFYSVEHPLMMLIAVSLISLGLFQAKKKPAPKNNLFVFIYYTLSLAIILYMIPWATVL